MNTRNTNYEVIATLNSLIETCKDGEHGFRTAGDAIENPDLKTMLHILGQQRARFASELGNEVLRHGADPVEVSHLTATLHRGWLHLKTAIAHNHEAAILDECERGEAAAMSAYEDAMKKHLPGDLMDIVTAQYAEIRTSHATIKGLKADAHAAVVN